MRCATRKSGTTNGVKCERGCYSCRTCAIACSGTVLKARGRHRRRRVSLPWLARIIMFSRLDDALIDHRKVFVAASLIERNGIGKNGAAIAVGLYAIGLMWSNKHLTDGHLPAAVVQHLPHVESS